MNFNYNGFYDETNNAYAITYPIEPRNGSLYHTIEVAFDYEGVYPSLMVSADDVTDVTGGDTNPWKRVKPLRLLTFAATMKETDLATGGFRGFPSWLCSI